MNKKLSCFLMFVITICALLFLMMSCIFDINKTFKFELLSGDCYAVKEYENGNGDNLPSSGESLYLDVKFKNVGNKDYSDVTVRLDTSSEYVSIIRGNYTFDYIADNKYYTLTDFGSSASYCHLMSTLYESYAFKIFISNNCPDQYIIPFILSFSDKNGNTTTNSFSVTVFKSQANIVLISSDNYEVKEYENGNGDGLVTPGESLYLDVKVQNKGTSDALGVEAKLSTTSKYVTIIRDNCKIGNMKKNYYYTLTSSSSFVSSCLLMSSNCYETMAFKFFLTIDCPEGICIPFVITYTDAFGNTWSNDLNLLVSNIKGSLDRNLWGSWIKMDTGVEYYIDTINVYESSSSDKKYKPSLYNVNDFELDGDNVIKYGSSVFFRKGGSARGFTMNVSGFSDSESYRAMGSSMAGIAGYRKNKNNQFDEESAVSASDGKISFTNAVADDVQEVSVSSGTADSSISVAPAYDGQNIGTIPLVEPDMYGFKTTYSIDGDNQGFCYGNSYKNYNLNLQINNIGSETCKTSVYEISCGDPKLTVVSGGLTGNFSSVEPGKSKIITLSVKYGTLTEEYIDVPISISITDSKYTRTWNDTVTIRFYKGVVSLKVNARNFEGSGATLKGFLIYPDGRSKRFTVSAGSTQTVLVPWSNSYYVLAFSGATTTSELAYSFAFVGKSTVADLSGTWSIDDINAYENNDSFTKAYTVYDLSTPVKAYLSDEDIDFYRVNINDVALTSN